MKKVWRILLCAAAVSAAGFGSVTSAAPARPSSRRQADSKSPGVTSSGMSRPSSATIRSAAISRISHTRLYHFTCDSDV